MDHKHQIAGLELLGIPFIIAAGSALHFTFEWSGFATPVALIAAVNESVWEHLKLAFWPSLLWGFIAGSQAQSDRCAYWSAKALGLLVAPVLIVAIFYTYTGLLGRNLLMADIGTFVIAIIAGQWVTARLVMVSPMARSASRVGMVLLVVQISAFSTFTFLPPPLPLFEDSRSGLRGIPPALLTIDHDNSGLLYRFDIPVGIPDPVKRETPFDNGVELASLHLTIIKGGEQPTW